MRMKPKHTGPNRSLTGHLLVFALLALLAAPPVRPASVGKGLTLVEDGEPRAVIVVSEKPSRAASLAACELQAHIEQITGAKLPLTTIPQRGTISIHVGHTDGAVAAGLTDWEPQEYAVKFTDSATYLAGQDAEDRAEVTYDFEDPFAFRTWPGLFDAQGTLHAVYHFLRTQCDVRWYTPTEFGTVIPQTDTLTVSGEDVRRRPAFLYRDLGHIGRIAEAYDAGTQLWPADTPEFNAYIETAYPEMRRRWGGNRWKWIHGKRGWTRLWLLRNGMGGSERYVCNHSFYGYYDRFWKKKPKNMDVFVERRPEFFAKGYPEKDRPPQMCYTNEGFIQQVIADARQYFNGDGKPYRALAHGDYFALCPMDNRAYCRGDACRATFNREERDSRFFSNGLHSDYQFGFYNKVARAIQESHPDKFLSTLAYSSYARYPENVEVAENIAVQLCLHVRNVYDVAQQKNDTRILQSWTRDRGRRVYLWLYYTFPRERGHRANPPWHVFPGYFAHAIGRRFKQYHEAGIRGAFFNGFGQEVEALVTFRMLRDPSEKVDDILAEYFSRYYGAAAAPMRELYLLIEDIYCDPGNYTPNERGRIGHQTERMALTRLYTPENLAAMEKLMQKARARAQSPVEKKRVELFDLSTFSYMQAAVRSTAKLERRPEWSDHPATLTRVVGRSPELKDNALRGRPFAYDTKGCLQILNNPRRVSGKPFTTLTDGQLEDMFTHRRKAVPVKMRCDLGPVPDGGRELRAARIIWSIRDPHRSRAVFRIEVHDAETRTWKAVTRDLVVEGYVGLPDSYRVLTVPFPAGGVSGFDAIRVVDLSHTRGWNTPRLVEVEARIE